MVVEKIMSGEEAKKTTDYFYEAYTEQTVEQNDCCKAARRYGSISRI